MRLSVAEYRGLAARWRQLAADATTPKTRNHLLTLARQCDYLAGNVGDVIAEIAAEEQELGGETHRNERRRHLAGTGRAWRGFDDQSAVVLPGRLILRNFEMKKAAFGRA